MIAAGAVTPANIETTSTFSFNKVSIPEIEVSGSSGLKIDALRSNTSSWVAYFNPTSKELTYGPATWHTGTVQVFDQNLNTTDKVTFAGVAATTATFGGVNIANLRINNAFTMPTTAGSSGQVWATNGTTATWVTPTPLNSNQGLYTTSSVTFANITATTNLTVGGTANIYRLVANGNTFPIGLGSAGQYLKTDGAGNLSWAAIDFSTVTNQTLFTTSTVTFKTVKTETVEGTLGVGKDLYLQTGGNGSIILRDPTAIATVVGVYGDIIPFTHNKTTYPRNLGSALRRWQNAWIETLTVNRNTIYFEDETANTTSTLSISTGTMYVDGAPVVDQSVTTVSSPTFASVNGTTSTFEDIVVTSELFFGDDSVQTTAFNGNQALYNTSTVAFGAMTVTNSATVGALVFSSDGLPINSRSELIGPQGPQGDPGQNSNLYEYKANTNSYANNPGNGKVLWNNATQTSATALHFNHVDNIGDDIEYLLGFHQVGDLIRLQDRTNSENYQVWQISAPITVNTGTYISMPVSLVSSTHNFSNNNIVLAIFRSAGADQSLNTTSNVTFNSVQVSTNVKFPDSTTQTTAWTGSVSTSSVTGLATVGWSGNYNDLSNRPSIASSDQALFTTSSVRFSGLGLSTGTVVNQTISAGGLPLNSSGQALITFSNTQSAAMVVSNYSGNMRPTLVVRSFGQNIPGGGATSNVAAQLVLEGSRGTGTSPTASGNSDNLGAIQFTGYDGANWLSSQATSGVSNLPPASIFVQAAEVFANNGSTTTNAGTNMFFRLQPIGTRLDSTSRRTWMASSWTAGSTLTNSPPILGMGIGQSTDASSPTLTPASGVGSFGTGSGRTNFAWNAVQQFIQGVPSQDTAPDNATLTATNAVTFITHRRSNVATRRNALQTGDTVGVFVYNAQNANNSSGNGATVGTIAMNMLETAGAGAYGSQFVVQTVNTGTTTLSTRLALTDRFNVYASNNHSFNNAAGTQTYLQVDGNGITVGTGTNIALIAARSGQDLQLISGGGSTNGGSIQLVSGGGVNIAGGNNITIAALSTSTANFYGNIKIGNTWTLPATDGTSGQVLATNGSGTATWTDPSITSVYARSALPSGTTGRIITISDSGSDTNAPAGNYAPAYWDPDADVWTYIGNSNSVTPI